MPDYHLAQINIARMLAPIDDLVMAEFVAQLAPVNALADETPGFVWRLQTESGDATGIKVYDEDMIIVNLTVWESAEALREFVYKNAHYGVLHDRKRWFEKFEGPYYAMWWIPAGQLPSIEEGKERLEYLREHGDSYYAFSFKHVFPMPVGA
jgi:heme-degrading monooxygenase HmoA